MKSYKKKYNNNDQWNEMFTTYDTCEIVFRPIVDHFMHKHIHCPCDDENSNIVKWLQDNTDSTITYSGLPDVDMNSDEAHELMLAADMVVTNPPFRWTVWSQLVGWLLDNQVDFLVFGGLVSTRYNTPLRIKILSHLNVYVPPTHRSNVYFYKSNIRESAPAFTYFYTNLDLPSASLTYKPNNKPQEFYNDIPVYNRSEHVPPDYDGEILVPASFIKFVRPKDLDWLEYINVPGKYTRLHVKRKKQ